METSIQKKKIEQDKEVLPVVIHDDIFSKIYNYYKDLKPNDTALSYGVYTFLYKTARIQNNIRIYATDTFIKKGTGIGTDKLKKIKRDLKELDLIQLIRPRDKNGRYTDESYIEVKYVWKPDALDKLFYQDDTDLIRYKIARELLLNNFDDYETIKCNELKGFYVSVNGREEGITANTFYFECNVLKCEAEFSSGNIIVYTVPEDRAMEIIIDLANNYKFNLNAIIAVLSKA